MNDDDGCPEGQPPRNIHAGAIPPLDLDKYREEVEGLELTREQQDELLRTLWWIMASFVHLGFAVDSVQHVLPAFAEASSPPEPDALEEGNKPGISGSAQAAPKEEIRHEP